jgi:hypothetical protein
MSRNHQTTDGMNSGHYGENYQVGVDDRYDVGYGKPPASTRFKKGQSGNPAGRPKGTLNLGTLLKRAILSTVTVTENGRRVKRSKIDVAVTQLANKAASGDLKAFRELMRQLPHIEALEQAGPMSPDLAADRELAQRLMLRMVDASMESDGDVSDGAAPGARSKGDDHEND